VRDILLHNIHAREFSKHAKTMTDYSDPMVIPETNGRLVIPTDIDCLMSEQKSDELIRHLSSNYFIKVKEVTNVFQYRSKL